MEKESYLNQIQTGVKHKVKRENPIALERILELQVKIFADGADLQTISELSRRPYISGLTTNPTLMRNAGVKNYMEFAREIVATIGNKPISLEVFADDHDSMISQAEELRNLGDNVYVKIPVTFTSGASTYGVIEELTRLQFKVNVTAIMTLGQVKFISRALNPDVNSYMSIFAGRISDTGVDPMPILTESISHLSEFTKCEVIWASPRELLNIVQAAQIGCHCITVTPEILSKLFLLGYDLETYSLDTVKMFYQDALKSGYEI